MKPMHESRQKKEMIEHGGECPPRRHDDWVANPSSRRWHSLKNANYVMAILTKGADDLPDVDRNARLSTVKWNTWNDNPHERIPFKKQSVE